MYWEAAVFCFRVHFRGAVMHLRFTGHRRNRLKIVALMMYSDTNHYGSQTTHF